MGAAGAVDVGAVISVCDEFEAEMKREGRRRAKPRGGGREEAGCGGLGLNVVDAAG